MHLISKASQLTPPGVVARAERGERARAVTLRLHDGSTSPEPEYWWEIRGRVAVRCWTAEEWAAMPTRLRERHEADTVRFPNGVRLSIRYVGGGA